MTPRVQSALSRRGGAMPRPLVVVDAPSNLGLKPPRLGHQPGARHGPTALRAAGLVQRLVARDGGIVEPPPYSFELPADPGLRNLNGLVRYTPALAARIDPLLAEGAFPLVLGGDCSILLGIALALRRRGRHGLVFVDGHADYLTPATSATGGAAGMDLALVTGLGPAALTNLAGLRPMVRPEDAVAVGFRDGSDGPDGSAEFRASTLTKLGLARLREIGFAAAAAEILAVVDRPDVAGFWVHLDVDVLDDRVMPAVDSPAGPGPSWDEILELLRPIARHERAIGMQVTIYDPERDPDGRFAAAIVDALAAILTPP